MPPAFLAPSSSFCGRNELIARFKARLEHYSLFIYEGIAGIGTTSLACRLTRETKAIGAKASRYVRLVPGEGVNSVVARVEAMVRGKTIVNIDRQGDPFSRLVEALSSQRVVIVLDGLHNLRREDLPALVRSLRAAKGPFRVIATSQGDPGLSAMDAALLHMERVGPLSADEVRKIATTAKLSAEAVERLAEDAARGGATGQPLTLRYLVSLCGSNLPDKAVLDAQTARSVNAFRALAPHFESHLVPAEREALVALSAIGEPVTRAAAVSALGSAVNKLLSRGLVSEIEGDIYIHALVSSCFGQHATFSGKQSSAFASHLRLRAKERSEPLSLIRAGKLLAQAGQLEEAVATLADGWQAVRDLGFCEAYLRILASIPAAGALAPRLALLSAQARIGQGAQALVREELERLAQDRDAWTKTRALAALTIIYSELEDYARVVKTFEALTKANASPDQLIPVGPLAATAMVKLGHIAKAEKLGTSLLKRLRSGHDSSRYGELHRLLSQVYAQTGRLTMAVEEAGLASKHFTAAGDLYHAATAAGFIGDLYRETGDFELAQAAFRRFHELALKWGDRNLIQIADLTEAWVALDIGDITNAQRRISAVEKDLSTTASRRLRRYLATAKALLEVGRGRHEAAAEMLPRVVDLWDSSGPRTVADMLRTQLIRSYIAVGRIDEASEIVDESLKRLDPKTAAPRVAMFLRESALIRLKRKDSKHALAELGEACKLFAKGGNRREEAHTLYRIAHAAFDEGDVALALQRSTEALGLARKIKHTRVVALARELQGRLALVSGDADAAVAASREALSAVKSLGDEISMLHVTELLLSAQIASGDLASAVRLGPRLVDQAEALGVREVCLRATALTGAALVRKGKVDAAQRCFRELGEGTTTPWTAALMWRLGEALAALAGNAGEAEMRRASWVALVRRLAPARQHASVRSLVQLELPPRERCQLRTRDETRAIASEEAAWFDAGQVGLFVDLLHQRAFVGGKSVVLPSVEGQKLLACLAVMLPKPADLHTVCRSVMGTDDDAALSRLQLVARDLTKVLHAVKGFKIDLKAKQAALRLSGTYAVVIPSRLLAGEPSREQKQLQKVLRRLGCASLVTLASELKLKPELVKRELDGLLRLGFVESVRDGRGRAFRLA